MCFIVNVDEGKRTNHDTKFLLVDPATITSIVVKVPGVFRRVQLLGRENEQ